MGLYTGGGKENLHFIEKKKIKKSREAKMSIIKKVQTK